MHVLGTIGTLDHGGALRARQCGSPFALPAGPQLLVASQGVFRIDWLRVRSRAPVAVAPPASGGLVLDGGRLGRTSVTGVRVALRGPSWLVLGESYDRGWRASCDGRSLGSPAVIDGYANGWRAPASCRRVSFTFAPQRAMVWLYVLSGLAVLVLAGLLLLRRVPTGEPAPTEELRVVEPTERMPVRRAALIGLAAGVALGFVFSIRSGIVIAPVVALICWRGIGAWALTLAAAVLLVAVVPAIYLSEPFRNLGGYDFNYAIDLIAAHWVAVAAVVLLLVALARTLSEARAARRSPERPDCSARPRSASAARHRSRRAGTMVRRIDSRESCAVTPHDSARHHPVAGGPGQRQGFRVERPPINLGLAECVPRGLVREQLEAAEDVAQGSDMSSRHRRMKTMLTARRCSGW